MTITPIITDKPVGPGQPWSGSYTFATDTYKYLLNVRVKNPSVPFSSPAASDVKLDFICAPAGLDPTKLTPSFGVPFTLEPRPDFINTFSCVAQHPGAEALYFTVLAGLVAPGSLISVDIIEFAVGAGSSTTVPGTLGNVFSFANTAALSAFDVTDTARYPLGTIMLVWNPVSFVVESYVLTAGTTGLPANGQPSNSWIKG